MSLEDKKISKWKSMMLLELNYELIRAFQQRNLMNYRVISKEQSHLINYQNTCEKNLFLSAISSYLYFCHHMLVFYS